MTFEEKIPKMYELFLDTERQLIELSHIIPLDNPDNTYSSRLYALLHMTCAQIESMFKMLCSELGLKPECDKFPCYFSILNSQGMLECQTVYITKIEKKIQPFIVEPNKSPEWWQGYNDTKHELPEGIIFGNIGNTIKAMSALCILHNISQFTRYRHDDLLNKNQWRQTELLPNYEPSFIPQILRQTTRGIRNEIFFPLSSYFHPSASMYQQTK